jgi:hypothetical protein
MAMAEISASIERGEQRAAKNPAELPASSPNSGAGTEKRPSLTPLMVQAIKVVSRKKHGFFSSANQIIDVNGLRGVTVGVTSTAPQECGWRLVNRASKLWVHW